MSTINVVLFDLGATLLYFDGRWPDVVGESYLELAHALNRQGFTLPVDAFARDFLARLDAYYIERDTEFIEQSTETILRELLAEYGYAPIESGKLRPALDTMYAVTQRHWTLESDALPTLRRLRASGYHLGILSNAKDERDVQTLIDQNGLRPLIDLVLISSAVGVRKPHPRIFKTALAHFDVEPSEAVMVGDSLGADVLGAHNAGLRAIWITRRADRAANRAHEDTIQPDAVISCLADLPVILNRMDEPGR